LFASSEEMLPSAALLRRFSFSLSDRREENTGKFALKSHANYEHDERKFFSPSPPIIFPCFSWQRQTVKHDKWGNTSLFH